MKPCAVIPCFDHGDTVGAVVDGLAALEIELPCLIVDDGSGAETRERIERVRERHAFVSVERHAENRGRGAALETAYRSAFTQGFSHAVQLDADGQHDAADVPRLLEAAATDPQALVLGEPIFDDSAPRARLWGRKLSQGIVWLQTLSFAVHDPLCGFRCVPLERAVQVLDAARLGRRMDFDPELIVRMVRAGAPVRNVPTRVRYLEGGLSHFHMLDDNLRIAWAYARLALDGLLGRGS